MSSTTTFITTKLARLFNSHRDTLTNFYGGGINISLSYLLLLLYSQNLILFLSQTIGPLNGECPSSEVKIRSGFNVHNEASLKFNTTDNEDHAKITLTLHSGMVILRTLLCLLEFLVKASKDFSLNRPANIIYHCTIGILLSCLGASGWIIPALLDLSRTEPFVRLLQLCSFLNKEQVTNVPKTPVWTFSFSIRRLVFSNFYRFYIAVFNLYIN